MAAGVTMRQMLEAGVHFGHQTRRWNPRMRQFIFTERNGIHILDLAQTVHRLDFAVDTVREVVSSGEQVLLVGTKKQAQVIIQREAERCGMPYVNTRWLGGSLTNFTTIARRIEYYKQLERRFGVAAGSAEAAVDAIAADTSLTKRERLGLQKEFERLSRSFHGMRTLTRLPGLLFIIDPTIEEIAVHEANRMGIPIVAMCDTNANPDVIQFPIPSNDDAIRAIQLITGRVADAVLEGIAVGEVEQQFDAATAGDAQGVPAGAEASGNDQARQRRGGRGGRG
ncbi:MAG: 30S ribosomal protein S2, partial [Chloroflexi bacterium]|nr:30S ribosomal protein S2 [Chloroflexota bacterium]